MKIAVNPQCSMPAGRPTERNVRRLLLLAFIAKDMGHDVVVHSSTKYVDQVEQNHPEPDARGYMQLSEELSFRENVAPFKPDVYVCSTSAVKSAPAGSVVIAWAESFHYRRLPQIADRCSVIASYMLRRTDFSGDKGLKVKDKPEHFAGLEGKTLSVPWLIMTVTFRQLQRDGLIKSYCRDDLAAIREQYSAPEKNKVIGFLGNNMPPYRMECARQLPQDDRFTLKFTGGIRERSLQSAQYLRWLSECQAILHLPGDTWKCARFSEAVMMGVPVIVPAGKEYLTPPTTSKNAIPIESWSDADTMFAGIERSKEIVASADAAYREGWSLRGQFIQALKKAGVSP